LKSARRRNGWSQHEAAARLGVSQSYLAMLESGSRRLPRKSVRRFSKTYGLAPTSLPLPTNLKPSEETAEALAAELAALGYEGFAHLRSRSRQKNPALVLLTALAQPKLEARLFEALPWLMVQYSDMPFDWLVQQAKLLDLQNLLGFVTTLAREVVKQQAPNQTDRIEALRKLEDALENSKLAKVEPLGKLSVGPRERQWLTENRSKEATRWNLLTDWRPEMLRYASR
jgi:transcriptional regulator with XRE-family HTH domain